MGGIAINTSQSTSPTSAARCDLRSQVDELTARIQELQKEQELWVKVEKEAAVGRLARGVAHEINNPLQGVLGFVQLLIQKLKEGELDRDQALQSLEWIENSALRCKRIVDALLDFSAREEGLPRIIDIMGLLELNLVLLEHELRHQHVELVVDSPGSPVAVRGNPSQLTQGLFNILANARDAVATGGRIRVEVTADEDHVMVAVSDNGPGIPRDNLQKIFDPFFSTKDVGQGTGLGLCVARGIFRVHGGDIRVDGNEPGGTRVEIALPRYQAEVDEPTAARD